MNKSLVGLLMLMSFSAFANPNSASKACELILASAAISSTEKTVFESERRYGGDPRIYGEQTKIRLESIRSLLAQSLASDLDQDVKNSISIVVTELDTEISKIYMYGAYKTYYSSELVELYGRFNLQISGVYWSACPKNET